MTETTHIPDALAVKLKQRRAGVSSDDTLLLDYDKASNALYGMVEPTHVLEYQLFTGSSNEYLHPDADGFFYLSCPDDFSLEAFNYSEMTVDDYTLKMMRSAVHASLLLLALPRNV